MPVLAFTFDHHHQADSSATSQQLWDHSQSGLYADHEPLRFFLRFKPRSLKPKILRCGHRHGIGIWRFVTKYLQHLTCGDMPLQLHCHLLVFPHQENARISDVVTSE